MKLKRLTMIVTLISIVVVSGIAVGATDAPVRLLVVDETHSVQSSLQIELFARALVKTEEFRIHALTEIPMGRNSGDPYALAVIVPANIDQVWIVAPNIPSQLPPSIAEALHTLTAIADRIYGGTRSLDHRAVVGVTDDLFPAVYSGFLVRNGWL